MKEGISLRTSRTRYWLSADCAECSIRRHLRINGSRPSINAAGHGLRLLEPLLPQPGGHVQRANSMMAIHNDMVVGVKLLMGAAGNIPHGYQLSAFDADGFELPGLADVEKREAFAAVRHLLHRLRINFI